MELDKYEPKIEWYLAPKLSYDVHGMGHATRVLIWADRIGRWMQEQGTPLDLEVVRWSAIFHDVRRETDGYDYEHGERAANWVEANAFNLPFDFNSQQIACTCYYCRWHVPRDEFIPEMTPELQCLKDADGLDRVRLGDLKVDYLRTNYAKTLVSQAQTLYKLSHYKRLKGEWTAVREAAIELGLWR
jgi:HD superfamily phosphodiesterase